MYTAEQQLLYEQKRTIGLHRYEIDRQLREVRQQRMAIERLRAEALQGSNRSSHTRRARSAASAPRPAVYRPPEPDWKTIETPQVIVKGTMMVDGRMAALVSGGQIVRSNQVFATVRQGETRYWRVNSITDVGADFARVTETGNPFDAKPKADDPAPAEGAAQPWLARLMQVFYPR